MLAVLPQEVEVEVIYTNDSDELEERITEEVTKITDMMVYGYTIDL